MRDKPSATSWITAALLLAAIITLFARLRSQAVLSFYEDDAFYYFQIARNIATRHFSSFDGIHPTNGYHPLWMMLLVASSLLASGKAFFVLVQCIALASFIVSFFTARRILRIFSSNLALTELAASAIALQCLLLLRGAMEVVVAIPLALLVCWYRLRPGFRWTFLGAIGYGLLAALVVLARLDAEIFIALLFLLDFALERPVTRQSWLIRSCALLSCVAPLLAYSLFNHARYQVWMPISGQAKQLLLRHSFTLAKIKTSLGPINLPYWLFIIFPTLLALLVCIAGLLKSDRPNLRPATLAVSLSLIAFPILQLLAFWTLSDWPVWSWYLYSFILAMTGCCILISNQYPTPQASLPPAIVAAAQTLVLAATFIVAWANTIDQPGHRNSWYLFAMDLEAFAQSHPDGTYAMGDCAGTAGYLLPHPLVQLEGLVMDAPFLDNIRQQRNLNQVLGSYHVRYYVTVNAEPDGTCFRTVEPALGGVDSPHMQGTFCQPPTIYPHGTQSLYIFDLNHH